jgi:hypothetical protein
MDGIARGRVAIDHADEEALRAVEGVHRPSYDLERVDMEVAALKRV